MNIMQDDIDPRNTRAMMKKPMVVKPTKIGNPLMPPPSNAAKRLVTPSSSRNRPKTKDGSSSQTKSTPTHRDSHIIAAICEGRGKATGIVGIAAVDVHRPVLILSQISDTQNYTSTLTKLNILGPVEIIVPATFVEGSNRIISVIVSQFPNLTVNSVPRSEFNRGRGLQMIQNICATGFTAVILQIEQKFYTLASTFALLRYIEQSRRVLYSPKTLKVEYQEPEFTTAIDIDTANILDLTSSSRTQNVNLFTVLNYCSTTPGKKLLRTNILQPPCIKNVIQTRLDCIQELLENPNILTSLQETLKPLCDIESSLRFATILPSEAVSVSEKQLNYTLQLKGLLNAVQPLANELKATKHPVFKYIYNRIEGLDTRKKILDLINEIINEDAHLAKGQAGELQRCFAIKCGVNGFLDLSRRLYSEGVDAMRAYVENLSQSYNLPLRAQHTIKSGFHIILPLSRALRSLKKADLPEIFIKVERYSNHFYLTTTDMINFDKRLKNNSTDIQNISNVIIYQLLVNIRPYISDLYNLCDDVAQIDMIVSLARVSSLPNWVRPKIVETHMILEGARHPILEHVGCQDPVSNTVYAYPRLPLHIITGPNMSGKTITLHSICLIQILFQLGSYVPCSEATLRVAQRVYARVADDDELALQASSFTLEMAKISYLVNTVNEKSLVVLDEICQTTGCDEGAMLAFALCEKLAKVGCFTFIGTHYHVLTLLEDLYPNIANWHLETIEENRANNTRISLKFTYKLLPGVTSISQYGIKLSRVYISHGIISDRAEALHNWLLPLRKSLAPKSIKETPDYLKHKFQAELDLLKIKNQLTDETQKEKIINFQTKTGLNFEPSPLLIEHSNSSLNHSGSKNKTSSKSTSKEKTSVESISFQQSAKSNNSASDHKFSVPTSSKSQENPKNNIFSFDMQDERAKDALNYSFESYEKMNSFHSISPHLTPVREHISSGTSKNYLFYNTDTDSMDLTFSGNNELSSIHKISISSKSTDYSAIKNKIKKSGTSSENPRISNNNFSKMDETQSMDSKNTSGSKNYLETDNNSSKINEPNIEIIDSFHSESTNWFSAENSRRDINSINIVVDSTPETSPKISRNGSKLLQGRELQNISSVEETNEQNKSENSNLKKPLFSFSYPIQQNFNEKSFEQDVQKSNPFDSLVHDSAKVPYNLALISDEKQSETSSDSTKSPNSTFIVHDTEPILLKNTTLHLTFEEKVETVVKQNSVNKMKASFVNTTEGSSPILAKKRKPNSPVKIQLVSNMYDSLSSDSEDNSSNNSEIIFGNDLEDSKEICSLDELNFSSYLNMKNGLTSTPIRTKENSLKYTTANSAVINSEDDFLSPVLNRRNRKQENKLNDGFRSTDNTSYESCASSKISNYSSSVIVGENFKAPPCVEINEP